MATGLPTVACVTVRRGLLHVDIFAGLTRPDSGERVPVIGQWHGDGVDVLVGEDCLHVAEAAGFAATGLFHLGDATLERGLVDIAESGDLAVRNAGVHLHVRTTAAPQADDTDLHAVIGTHHPYGLGSGEGGEKKGAAGTHERDLITR